MVKCRKCNRPLTNPESIAAGIGKICAAKYGTFKTVKRGDGDTDTFVQYEGGNFWIERIHAKTLAEFPGVTDTVMVGQTHPASGIRTNVPRQIYRHSPTGFNFGYAGSGPADFALNICLLLVHADDAYKHYQAFKCKFVAVQCDDRLEISRSDAEQFFIESGVQLLKN